MAPNAFILKVVKGTQTGREFSIQKRSIYLGSAYTQNDLVMNMENISVQHAHIWCKKEKYFIENLSPEHIIFIDGKAIKKNERSELNPDSVIDLDSVSFQFIVKAQGDNFSDGRRQKIPFHPVLQDLIGRSSSYWRQLSKPKQMLIAGCVAIIIFAFLFKAVSPSDDGNKTQAADKAAPNPVNLSKTPVPLPTKGEFGYIKNSDESHCDGVIFTFKTDSSNVDFYYTIGGVESEKEVVISLNDHQISYAPLAENAWGEETHIRLPKEYVDQGGVNRLLFDNTKNPPGKDRWAVKNVRVDILPADACEMDEAKKYFDLGEKMYTEKGVSKGNPYLAYKYYEKAVSYLQGCDKKENIFHKADRKRTALEKEIDKNYNDLMFAFKKAVKAKDYMSGRTILQDIIQYIPEESDERHKKAAKALEVFNDALGLTEE